MKVAFVVQRCGREVNGGAEMLCLQVALHMGKHWQTEILTTCALDYMSWDNYYSEEPEIIGSTTVRRFTVDRPRDTAAFDQLSKLVREAGPTVSLAQQEKWMRAQGPISSGLFSYLKSQKQGYDAFLFFGYLYATTYFGLPIVAEKAFLAPCAHDEWPIHLPVGSPGTELEFAL